METQIKMKIHTQKQVKDSVFGAEKMESDVEATSFPGLLSCKPDAHCQSLTKRILVKISLSEDNSCSKNKFGGTDT